MKRLQTTDFDVITGPSMASACPVVETAPLPATPPDEATAPRSIATKTELQAATAKADAA